MRTTAYRTALDLLAWLACILGSVSATVLALTHPEALDIHRHGLYLDVFAATLGLALFAMLDRATDHLAEATWRRGDTERRATCGEPLDDAEDVALIHRQHTDDEGEAEISRLRDELANRVAAIAEVRATCARLYADPDEENNPYRVGQDKMADLILEQLDSYSRRLSDITPADGELDR